MFTKLRIPVTFLTALFISTAANADLAIIAHPDSDTGKLDAQKVRNIFLGERKKFPTGLHAVPFNHTEDSPDRKEFFSLVLSMAEKNHSRHWKRKISTGAGNSPTELHSHKAVLESIANTPGGIGYIDASKVDDSVKVLFTISDFDAV